MIAAVVISSAAVNAERVSPEQKNDQAYLAVVSALNTADDLVKANGSICDVRIEVSGGTVTTTTAGSDGLGLGQWATVQVGRMENGGIAEPKNVVVSASDMGNANVPDVLLTFTMTTDRSIYVRACQDVWGSSTVPTDETTLKADLAERGLFGYTLNRQVASSGSSGTTVFWDAVEVNV